MPKIKNVDYQFSNEEKDGVQIVTLAGTVMKQDWREDSINLTKVESILNESEGPLVIRLNSHGGDVFEGIAIYNSLKDSKRPITVEVTALAASAASLIAMGADEIVMCTGSSMMIHEASTITWGNKHDIKKTLNALETVDESITNIYMEKTGKEKSVINEWLVNETWFTADEAINSGLADNLKKEPSVNNEIFKPMITNKKIKIFGGK